MRREVWRDRVWSVLPMYVVADRDDLLALYLPGGSPMGFAQGEWPTPNGRHAWDDGPDTRWQGHGVLHLQRPGEPYAVWVFWHGPERRFEGWYLNLQAPFERTMIGIDTLDHELDIVVGLDGTWRFKDVAETEECVALGRFTRVEVDGITATGHGLAAMLDAGDRWWTDDWAEWSPPATMGRPPTLAPGWHYLWKDFTPADQPETSSLIAAGLAENWGAAVDDSLNPDLDDIAAIYGHGRTIVHRDLDGIAATGTLVPHDEKSAEIVRMSVRRDRRRAGLGRAAVAELIATAKSWGIQRVILETTSDWANVVSFYQQCGFTITHETNGEFGRDTWFELRL